MIFIYISVLLIIVIFLVLNHRVFGQLPRGPRLNVIRHLNNYKNGALQNLTITPMQPEGVSLPDVFKAYFFGKHPNRIPAKALRFVKPDLNSEPESNLPEIIWFGHSSYLIKAGGKRILVDPIFSKRPSPFSFIGSTAFPGTNFIKAEEFLNIDVLVITHDHYDHLDYQSILKIGPYTKKIVTAIGVGSHLESWGIPAEKITELCWNETAQIFDTIKFTAVPARHFAGRKFKRNQTLWSAFILETAHHKLFLGGDSGYDTHFKEIGNDYGPFDLAFLECGQYHKLWPYIHMFPEQTVQAALDLQAKILMPVHWGKFSLAMHPWNEPIESAIAEAADKNLQIITPKPGETVILNKDFPNQKWWSA